MNNVIIDISDTANRAIGIRNNYASAVMNNLKINISSGDNAVGVWNTNSGPPMNNVAMILNATSSDSNVQGVINV